MGNSVNLNVPDSTPFAVIRWYKGSRDNIILEFISRTRRTTFYNEYCSGTSPCTESDKGGPSPFGDFTIYSLIVNDTDYYYYNIVPTNGPVDPGYHYEIYLDVKGRCIFLQCLTSYKTFHKFIYLCSQVYHRVKFATFFEVITDTIFGRAIYNA